MFNHRAISDRCKPPRYARASALAALFGCLPVVVSGQAVQRTWVPAGTGDYTIESNWITETGNNLFLPEGREDEEGVIDNGGTAVLYAGDSVTELGPGDLHIVNGSLVVEGTLVFNDDNVSGGKSPNVSRLLEVGSGDGVGTLTVPGGTLGAASLIVAGNADSSANFSGAASVTIDDQSTINRTLSITGPNVNYTTGSLNLTGSTTVQAIVTDSTHSLIDVEGIAFLSGAELNVDLSGAVLTPGQRWDIIRAATFSGDFGSVSVTGVGPLGPTQVFALARVPDGVDQKIQIGLEQTLVLEVDRSTGAVSISNPLGTPVEFDGYTIASPAGMLSADPSDWTGLAGSEPEWQKSANSDSQRLTETRPSGYTALTGDSLPLGDVFSGSPSTFGEDPEDVSFVINKQGLAVQGIVEFSGVGSVNNLMLTVDPTSGEAALRNDSNFTVEIDGYTVTSSSGSLLDTWDGLAGNSRADDAWQQSTNSDAMRLTETNPLAVESLQPNEYFFLGELFNGGDEDLVLNFLLAGEDQPMQGVVQYADVVLAGDYNENSALDAADYTVWRDLLGGAESGANWSGNGTVDHHDYTLWKSNFGLTGSSSAVLGGSSQQVPEPASAVLLATLAIAATASARKQR